MRSKIILCMVALDKIPSSSSFINHGILPVKTRAFDRSRVFADYKDNDDAIFDAEEAAAVDAHDVSDSGMEGAAMERAVIMAAEFKEQHIEKGKEELLEVRDAEANFAHDLSDAAAVEHANKIPVEDSGTAGAEDNDDALFDAKEAAAVDAHDVSDAGVEGAAMERSVIMAEELFKELQTKKNEEAAAVDAHDVSDAGIEGAAMERFVIKAEELYKELHQTKKKKERRKKKTDDKNRVTAGAEDSDSTLYDAEEAAAVDAHDVSDAGIEGAAMERSVIMAEELYKEQQMKKSKEISEVTDAEANFAHDLSDAAAVEHANEIPVEDSGAEDDDALFDAEEAAAVDAHDVSDAGVEGAAMERSVIVAEELYEELQTKNQASTEG